MDRAASSSAIAPPEHKPSKAIAQTGLVAALALMALCLTILAAGSIERTESTVTGSAAKSAQARITPSYIQAIAPAR